MTELKDTTENRVEAVQATFINRLNIVEKQVQSNQMRL